MKFITINLLAILGSLVATTAHANDTLAKPAKAATEIKFDEIKCGPLADFYELVAQRPQASKSSIVVAKNAGISKNAINSTLAANTSSQDGKKTE